MEEAAAPPPICVLLELSAYATGGRDTAAAATTGKARTSWCHAISATLYAAAPPLASHIRVHFPGLPDPADPCKVLAAADGLVLLGVAADGPVHRLRPSLDHFVYDPAMASLRLLPHHDPRTISGSPFAPALLRRPAIAGGGFLIAALVGTHRSFDLHRFRSDAGAWTTTTLQLDAPKGSGSSVFFFSHCSHKAVPLGGNGENGIVGWADLWFGVILCDVLLGNPELRYLPFPAPPTSMALLQSRGEPLLSRDVAAAASDNGRVIKLVDHRHNNNNGGGGGFGHGWTATVWRKVDIIDIIGGELAWEKLCEAGASEVLVPAPLPLPLPKPLPMLRTGHPAIGLEGGDVVYFMCKDGLRDERAWILAIDVRNKTLRGAAQGAVESAAGRAFGVDRTFYVPTLLPVLPEIPGIPL